ncbi:VOC family protein [Paraburkholderia sp. BCC1886]|uniref:VOC family protein n=1 Tax=Paraburkholderia sp. BCC1886 TaxID=2562670 RepID=UPI001181D34F|nr:VOC family protein [Paraburkholderia sp. BCC1886]
MTNGFSHIGVSTHDMERTIAFYEGVLGFPRVAEELLHINEGGTLRQISFDVGAQQYIVFMQCTGVDGISSAYDTGINQALGVPAGMYHYAFRESSVDALKAKRAQFAEKGVDVSDIIDLRTSLAFFFQDPNGLQLEFSATLRAFDETDLGRTSHASIAPGA